MLSQRAACDSGIAFAKAQVCVCNPLVLKPSLCMLTSDQAVVNIAWSFSTILGSGCGAQEPVRPLFLLIRELSIQRCERVPQCPSERMHLLYQCRPRQLAGAAAFEVGLELSHGKAPNVHIAMRRWTERPAPQAKVSTGFSAYGNAVRLCGGVTAGCKRSSRATLTPLCTTASSQAASTSRR